MGVFGCRFRWWSCFKLCGCAVCAHALGAPLFDPPGITDVCGRGVWYLFALAKSTIFALLVGWCRLLEVFDRFKAAEGCVGVLGCLLCEGCCRLCVVAHLVCERDECFVGCCCFCFDVVAVGEEVVSVRRRADDDGVSGGVR